VQLLKPGSPPPESFIAEHVELLQQLQNLTGRLLGDIEQMKNGHQFAIDQLNTHHTQQLASLEAEHNRRKNKTANPPNVG
jgi:hypothetical protein